MKYEQKYNFPGSLEEYVPLPEMAFFEVMEKVKDEGILILDDTRRNNTDEKIYLLDGGNIVFYTKIISFARLVVPLPSPLLGRLNIIHSSKEGLESIIKKLGLPAPLSQPKQ